MSSQAPEAFGTYGRPQYAGVRTHVSFTAEHPDGALIRVRVTPRASADQIGEERGNSLTVRLTAAPVDGKANKSLVKLLAKRLGVAGSSIELLRGCTTREKVLLVRGERAAGVEERLIQGATR
ncbi:MAG: DUF167 domain-containing protein [Pseudomonadota bacterium]